MAIEYRYEDLTGHKAKVSHLDLFGAKALSGERILITGAGGSIGSKIVKAISNYQGSSLLATDRDENRLHTLSLDLIGSALFNSSQFQVMDIKDLQGVKNSISGFKPTMIIHAAALKHLAILEQQPREAYLTNIIGTNNMLSTAYQFKVQKFLNISTDKAANPISVLGKTKYVAELLTSKYRNLGAKNFTSVRFGNVFNSRGSVIETFARQLESNLSVTLTDIDVARYFMKIEEAASLSLSAVFLNHNDVHILNMGEQIKLIDIINKMKIISGSSSKIEIVGLRQGEKLIEELSSKSELIMQTPHPEIQSIKSAFIYSDLPSFSDEIRDDFHALNKIENLITN